MQQKIVLIEDDADTCHILEKILTTAGYSVQTYSEGRHALEPNFTKPDLFLLDNHMPSIDGVALCKFLKIRENTRSVPIILTSGNHLIKNKAMKAGASAFLEKPFKPQTLLDAVKRLLEQDVIVETKSVNR